jgi:hypothetical protein
MENIRPGGNFEDVWKVPKSTQKFPVKKFPVI